jgi:hypothetical protein
MTVEGLYQHVEAMELSPEKRESLKQIVENFSDEINNEDPDVSQLRSLLDRAGRYGSEIRNKLMMMATERGVDLLANLS